MAGAPTRPPTKPSPLVPRPPKPYNPPSKYEPAPRTPPEAWRLQVLRHLQANPSLSQRQLAGQMGVSLGKTNYCLRALMKRGWVKMDNFRRNPNKMDYVYLLTPSGIEEKARFAVRFLRHKKLDFDLLKAEIERLKVEVEGGVANESISNLPAVSIRK